MSNLLKLQFSSVGSGGRGASRFLTITGVSSLITLISSSLDSISTTRSLNFKFFATSGGLATVTDFCCCCLSRLVKAEKDLDIVDRWNGLLVIVLLSVAFFVSKLEVTTLELKERDWGMSLVADLKRLLTRMGLIGMHDGLLKSSKNS